MKRVIDGKIYDTETATEIATTSGGGNPRDFHYWEETLYRSPGGKFFLYGEGGAMSRYSHTISENEWCGGSAIRLFDEEQARTWLEAAEAKPEKFELAGLALVQG